MTPASQRLLKSLHTEIALIQRFLLALQAESRALESPDLPDALSASTLKKNACADLLTRANHERGGILQELGFSDDRQGLESAAQDQPSLQAAVRELLELAEQARQLNGANGAIIDVHLKHTQQTLDGLRALTGENTLYDASGRTRKTTGNQRNIKAG